MRKFGIPIIFMVVIALMFFSVKIVKTSLFGEEKESFTFIGGLQATTYSTMPNVPLIEIYHDGPFVILAKIEKIEDGKSPYPTGSQIIFVVKDYSQFPNLTSNEKKYRITLSKFVEGDGFEYWRCRSKEI
jgi:hypothetical protein